jgi:hypothetical protein
MLERPSSTYHGANSDFWALGKIGHAERESMCYSMEREERVLLLHPPSYL